MNRLRQPLDAGTRQSWLAIAVGNSRVLWGTWSDATLMQWGRVEISPNATFERRVRQAGDRIWLASVGQQKQALQIWPLLKQAHQLSLADVPLLGSYDTLGLDRALASVGAAAQVGWPVVVVDGGTALTFTGVDTTGTLVGGAIAPGLMLQARSLHSSTAALPDISLNLNLETATRIDRWATATDAAIRSGIAWGAIATVKSFCQDWRTHFPDSAIVFTGGDGHYLHALAALPNSTYDAALVLRGIAACRERQRHSGLRVNTRQSDD